MDITKKNKEYKKNNYNKTGISIVIIIIAYVTAISSVIETGGFIVTKAQGEEQSPFGPVFPLPTSPPPPPPPTSAPPSRIVSPELKAKMCDPNNPKLEFVNSTESEVCGLPKSISNDTTTSPITPPSSPKPITPPSSPRSITPSRPPTPEEIPELP
jgi:hypothetical protein